jgi:hypothetical protein
VGQGEGSLVVAELMIILVKQPLVHSGRRLPHPPQGWGGGEHRQQVGGPSKQEERGMARSSPHGISSELTISS